MDAWKEGVLERLWRERVCGLESERSKRPKQKGRGVLMRHVHQFKSLELVVDPVGRREIHLMECDCGEFAIEIKGVR